MARGWWLGALLVLGAGCPVAVEFENEPKIATPCGEETCGAGQICVHQEDCTTSVCGIGYQARSDGSFCSDVPEDCASIHDSDCVIPALCPNVGGPGPFDASYGDSHLEDGHLECEQPTLPACGCSRENSSTQCGDDICNEDEVCKIGATCDADLCESESNAAVEVRTCVPIPEACVQSLDPACILPEFCGDAGLEDGSTFDDGEVRCAGSMDRCDCDLPDWPAVSCGDSVCLSGSVCVTPPLGCDYSPCENGGSAMFVSGENRCAPIPPQCDLGVDLGQCLQEALCGGSGPFGGFSPDSGTLTCGGGALDCFC